MKSVVLLGSEEIPNRVVGIKLDCPLVNVRYKEGNKVIEKQMRDVTDFFNNEEEIKAISIKIER